MIIFECDMCKMQHKAKRNYSDLNIVELNIGGNRFQICHKCASELLHKCEAGYNIGDVVIDEELEDEEASETITHEKGSLYYIKGKEGLYYITREIKPSPRSKCKYREVKYEVENSDTHEKFIVKESELEAYLP